MRIKFGCVLFAVGWTAAITTGTAQASNKALLFKFEISAAYAWETPRLNSTYLHSYAPPFTPGSYQSAASQTLVFKGAKAHGYATGMRFFPMPYVGVEVLYDAFKANMSGESSNYTINMKYVARQPPDDIPIEYAYQRKDAWPATDGEFKETIISVNAAARAPLGSRLSVKVSGGASFCTFEAQSSSIAFTKFWLGGHSVLFMQDYGLGLDWGSFKTTGFNIGGELILDVFSNMGISFDVRYFSFGKAAAPWRVMTGEGVSETAEELGKLMNLSSVTVDPSLFRAGLGLRFLF